MKKVTVPIQYLGQAGFRLEFAGVVIYIDPYLSDSVERIEGPNLKRMRPAPYSPSSVCDADFVLITHAHLDHCDPETVLPILEASPAARVIAPSAAMFALLNAGMSAERALSLDDGRYVIRDDLVVHAIPAAHPVVERDSRGMPLCVGYVIGFSGKCIYHSGDTSVDDEVISAVARFSPVDVAILPVNEKNFYRDKAGIVGNMSIREAFGLAEDIGAKQVVPMHYDMFKPNLTYLDELAIVYRELQPDFEMIIEPEELAL